MIKISTDKARLDIIMVHNYLSTESYWAKGREMEIVKRSIENSLCFGVYRENIQIGFARVVTDYVVFAWILDLFVLQDHRGKGYGQELVKTILTQENLKSIRRWGLTTKDAHGLYEQSGFKRLRNSENMMEMIRGIPDSTNNT